MMLAKLGSGVRRRWPLVAVQTLAVFLGACSALGLSNTDLLPGEDDTVATSFTTYDSVETAYGNVRAGETRVPELAQLGFDTGTAPNVERLSYLGVMDRFLPGSSIRFDKLAPAVQTCIESQEHCSAVIFRPAHIRAQRSGSLLLDLLGFERVTVSSGWSAEVIFLMQDGTVVYKVLQGKPRIQEVRDRVQPLGPLQDFGDTAFGVGTRAVKL
jgi:hypothetical protein